MPIPIIPTCPERDRLHEVANRIHDRYIKSSLKFRKEDQFLYYASKYGFYQIQQGNIPEEEIETARQFLKRCHQRLKETGYNPEEMFTPEIVHVLCELDFIEGRKQVARRDKAFAKIQKIHEQKGYSALKNVTKLIRQSFISYLQWVDVGIFPPTEEDKSQIVGIKTETLDRILMAMGSLSDWDWTKGYDTDSEISSLEEFLETARVALWFDFDQESFFYSKKLLGIQGFYYCNKSPEKEDDTRKTSIEFRLYSSFSTDEEVRDTYFNSYCLFTAAREEIA